MGSAAPLSGPVVIRRTRLLSTGWAASSDSAVDVVDVELKDGRIADIRPAAGSAGPAEAEVMDGSDWSLAPGLIDLQVNGGWGHDLTADPEAVWDVGAGLLRHGVTAWLPTLVSAPVEVRHRALSVLADGPPPGWIGAEPLGWHFEGPYLNPDRRGAHRFDAIEPVPANLAELPLPRLMTIAPELDGALDAVADLVERGVVVSIGHTNASAETVGAALAAGATMGTHLFNAMSGIHHREPGATVGLLDSNAWLGLIADGHHVAPEVMRLAWNLAGDRLVLVSDAMAGLGQADGPTTLGSRLAVIGGGAVRLEGGTLAGSVLPLDRAVLQFAQAVGVSLADAVPLATLHPARALGLAGAGRLTIGGQADLAAFDSTGAITATFITGRPVTV